MRIIMSILSIVAYGILNFMYLPVATLISGDVAGKQFDNSNVSYLTEYGTQHILSGMTGFFTLGLLIVLGLIWYGPAKKAIVAMMTVALIVFALSATPNHAYAYFDTVDRTEAYTILPNESAFWIPDVGANKDSQAKFDSQDYYNNNKIAVKRYVIPHQKLSGSGGTSFFSGPDSYVPTGRLILVDRSPYSREWVASTNRGTSSKDESFPCQSSEGLNVRVGVSIGTSVTEEDAANFLYHFGVLPPTVKGADGQSYYADRTDPKTIFTSVYYGRSLISVMDDVGRKKVQTLVCNEIAARTIDEDNAQATKIMTGIEKTAREYFKSVGITLDFIGYADTFEFDHDVQIAINDKYRATELQSSLGVLQAVANLEVQKGLAEGLKAHGLPIVIPENLLQSIANLAFHANAAIAPPVPAAK